MCIRCDSKKSSFLEICPCTQRVRVQQQRAGITEQVWKGDLIPGEIKYNGWF
jgi:hypothetical protein